MFFLWKVSNLVLISLLFFLWIVSYPGHWHQKLQEDWFGTKDEIGSSNVHLDSSNLHLDLVPQELILVTAPKFARGLDWVHRYRLLFIRFTPEFLYLVPQGEILVTAPKLQEDWLGTEDETGYFSSSHL